MANKEKEALNESESEGDSLSSLKGINEKSTKAKRGASPRTYSTSEVDREQKKSAKIVTEFLTHSPVINSIFNTTRHAPLLSHRPESNDKDIPVQQTAEMNLNTVCKKKLSRKDAATRPATFYSPPAVRPRPPNDSSPPLRPRSRSVPDYSEIQRSMKYLSDEEECVAKFVGRRLNDIASRMNPRLPYQVYERVLFEAITLALSQTGYQAVPVQVFRHALEMVQRRTSGWTYRSIMDMLFYGRKMFSQFLINFEGDDIDGLRLIDQFVDFFNVQCLPWIRSHGGWGKMLRHNEEGDMVSTLETSCEGDRSNQSSGYGSLGQPPIEILDEQDNALVTPTVFSPDSDEDSTLEPVIPLPPLSHSTPARQLSDIPEVESPDASLHLPPTTEGNLTPENVPSSMPPTESGPNTSSGNNILFYGTTVVVAGALIYNKLNC